MNPEIPESEREEFEKRIQSLRDWCERLEREGPEKEEQPG